MSKDERVNLYLVGAHRPTQDPRIEWEALNSNGDACVLLGVSNAQSGATVDVVRLSDDVIEYTIPGAELHHVALSDVTSKKSDDPMINAIVSHLVRIQDLPEHKLLQSYKVSRKEGRRFQAIIRHFLATYYLLIEVADQFGTFSNIVAADLDALLPALALKKKFSGQVIYDAHEYFPESSNFEPPIIAFWKELETFLVQFADERFIASEPSAEFVTQEYGVKFYPLNNCEPLASRISDEQFEEKMAHLSDRATVKFIFMGGISHSRGILPTVKAWHKVKSDAQFIIQGPVGDAEYFERVKAAAGDMWGKTIIQNPSVREEEMIGSCFDIDVGLIPYEPVSLNNKYCCPNKMSQYMCAGLPIICNSLPFVQKIVLGGDCGVTCDFDDADALAAEIDRMCKNTAERRQMARNARKHFETYFHWENQSSEFSNALNKGAPITNRDGKYHSAIMLDHLLTSNNLMPSKIRSMGCYPVWPLFENGQPTTIWNASLTCTEHRVLAFSPISETRAGLSVRLPAYVDGTAFFIRFKGAENLTSLHLRSVGQGGDSGFVEVIQDFQKDAYITWNGNSMNQLDIEIDQGPHSADVKILELVVYSTSQDIANASLDQDFADSLTESLTETLTEGLTDQLAGPLAENRSFTLRRIYRGVRARVRTLWTT